MSSFQPVILKLASSLLPSDQMKSFFPDRLASERGIYSQMSYALIIGIAVVISSVLMAGTGSFVSGELNSAGKAQLNTVGNRLAAQIMAYDHMAQQNPDYEATVTIQAPVHVTGQRYRIRIESGIGHKEDYLMLYLVDGSASVRVPMNVSTGIVEGELTSDDGLVIMRDDGRIKIEDTSS